MPQIKLTIIALALALTAVPLTNTVKAEESLRTITVQGVGSVTAKPDMAVVRAGVVTQAASPAAAITQNSQAVAKLLATAKRFGIADRDLQTANFSLNPEYRRDRQAPPQIVGYRVNNGVTIRVRALENLGTLLDALVDEGTNQLNGIGFMIEEPDGFVDAARVNAVADAKRRAALYARELGVSVGRALQVTETGRTGPQPLRMFAAAEARSSRAVPIAPGEQKISARVTVVFEIR